ncbi:MAG: Metal dependent phosphohydrolase, region [Proteobacteria bacterium]|nr:Metal dependent phosphohydrolase, region [Pseudomonadota bacterium]
MVEDTPATGSEIEARFGKAVALLVEGVSKLDKLAFESEQQAQAENFRKMLLAMARDVRVILVKLADRLHNMHTMGAMPAEKRKRIATETLEIYAPIANRLGLHSVYQELEDLGFRYSHPNRYQVLAKAVKAARGNRRELVDKIKVALQDKLEQCKIEATISGREKHLYSIYRKMQEKNLAFSEVFDIYGFRVVVRDQPNCYLALGALHSLYKPIPRRAPIAGCSRCSTSRPTTAIRRNSSSTSRSTCSPTKSTCSPPRARSWRCRAARRRSILPLRCTPTSAITASPSRSITN